MFSSWRTAGVVFPGHAGIFVPGFQPEMRKQKAAEIASAAFLLMAFGLNRG
jgi:hypothetical protein